MENHNEYLLYDLGCSAALITAGYSLVGLDRANFPRVGFLFNYSIQFQKALDGYWSNTLQVDARTLNENSKMLKTRIYSEK